MIKPDEIVNAKRKQLDPVVEQAVDALLAQNWNGRSSKVYQKDIVAKILEIKAFETEELKNEFTRKLFDEHMLDFEDIYRDAGWSVYYDKPGYNESYEASFEFKKK
jgi:hypothetical protein